MIIDKNGKLFGKVSIIDLAILLIVILVALGVGYKVVLSRTIVSGDFKNVVYETKVSSIRQVSVDKLKVGDEVYDDLTDAPLGKILDVKVENAKDYIRKQDGSVVRADKPDAFDVILTVSAKANPLDYGYMVYNKTRVVPGGELKIKGNMIVLESRVISIEESK